MNLLIKYLLISILLGGGLFLGHHFLQLKLEGVASFELDKFYLFFFFFSVLVYINMYVLKSNLGMSLGFLYLGLNLIKIGLFVFYNQELTVEKESLTISESLGVFVPFFLFLIVEILYMSKLLEDIDNQEAKH